MSEPTPHISRSVVEDLPQGPNGSNVGDMARRGGEQGEDDAGGG